MRLTLIRRTALVVFVALALLTGGFYLALHARLQRDVTVVLAARSRAAIALVVIDAGRLGIEETPHDETLEEGLWLFDPAGHVVLQPVASAALTSVARELGGRMPRRRSVAGVQLVSSPVFIGGMQVATVVVGLSLAPYLGSEQVSLAAAALLDLVVLLGTVGLTSRTVGSALRPVEEMTLSARKWSEHDPERRLSVGPERDELAHLAATLNGLLSRLSAMVRHEQRVTAEIAHEIKTPLARLRSSAEIALSYGDESERDAALTEVVQESSRLARIVDALLSATSLAVPTGSCDAGMVVADEIDGLRAKGASISCAREATTLQAGCDPDLLARALAPLTANAIVHANTVVTVTVSRGVDHILITVSDDGPGFRSDELESVLRPGIRGRGAVEAGYGLGLALARRLAKSAAGDIKLHPGPGGRVDLVLPAI